MKKLSLALVLILAGARLSAAAYFAPGTKALYLSVAGELVDATGNFANLAEVGSVPSNVTPTNCTSLGNFYGIFGPGSSNYYTIPAGLLTALQGYSNYSIEMCIWPNNFSASDVYLSDESAFFVQINTLGGPRWGSSGGILGPAGTAYSLSTSAKLLITYDGTNKRLYVNDVLTIGPTAQSASLAGLTQLRIGEGFTIPVHGFISYLRFMNIAATPPIIDVAPNPVRSPYTKNFNTPYIGSRRR